MGRSRDVVWILTLLIAAIAGESVLCLSSSAWCHRYKVHVHSISGELLLALLFELLAPLIPG